MTGFGTASVGAAAIDGLSAPRRRGKAAVLLNFAQKKPLGAAGAVLTLIFCLMAMAAPLFATHDPVATSAAFLESPGGSHWFGTDNLGRDVYSRVVYGARVSVTVGVISVVVSTLVGSALGIAAGFWSGWTDALIMRLVDVAMAFPSLILALAIMAMLGPSITNVIVAISITQVPSVARVVRSQVLSVKEQQFIEAAKSVGASDNRLVARHVAPNVLATILIYGSTNLGYAILTEGTLSFLGVGVPPPTATWGEMLSGQARLFFTSAPWIALFPIAALSFAILGVVLLADALRDVLDPRMRGSR